jgi:hypothetical protein
MLQNILTIFSVLTTMLFLKNIVSIFPSLAACMTRAKECFNLEASVKLSRDRDLLAWAMIIPFCLITYRFNLFGTGFMNGINEDIRLAATVIVFALYILFRDSVFRLFRPQRISKRAYSTAGNAAHTFFVILTFILLAAGGIMTITGTDEHVIATAMLWISASIYTLFIIRKLEIFTSSCSVFTAFLYLCALEIIPTGTLVISAIIL